MLTNKANKADIYSGSNKIIKISKKLDERAIKEGGSTDLPSDACVAFAASKSSTNRPINCIETKEQLNNVFQSSLKIEEELWLTSSEAAYFLGITVQALMNKVSGGKIPYYKFGRRNRYKKSELVALLSINKKGPYGNQYR